MDFEEKVIFGGIIAILTGLLLCLLAANWRWRANKADYIREGYTQKQVISGYKTIWVKDPNN